MINRKTDVWLDPEELKVFEKELYLTGGEAAVKNFQAALGRLLTFAPDSESYRDIHMGFNLRQKEVIATYSNGENQHRFTMGAIYHEKEHEWSFHS